MTTPEPNPVVAENNARNLPRFTSGSELENSLLTDQLTELTARMNETVACLKEWYAMSQLTGLGVDTKYQDFYDAQVKRTESVLLSWEKR